MSSVLKSKIETKAELGRPTKAGTAQETGGQDACAAGETRGSVYDGRHNSPGDRRPGLSSTFVFTEEARGCKMTCPGEHSHTCIRRDESSPRGEGAPRKAASQTQPGAAARPAPQLPKTDPQGAARASRTRREGIWSLRIGQTATMWASNWNLGVSLSSKH